MGAAVAPKFINNIVPFIAESGVVGTAKFVTSKTFDLIILTPAILPIKIELGYVVLFLPMQNGRPKSFIVTDKVADASSIPFTNKYTILDGVFPIIFK